MSKVNDFILNKNKIYNIVVVRSEVFIVRENKLADLSMDFAVKILKLCDVITQDIIQLQINSKEVLQVSVQI